METKHPIKVSIIIPIYKVEAYLERCIKSVAEQDGIGSAYNLECILVDDCTPDKSMKIAKETIKPYKNIHFICLQHEINRGLSVARDTGLEYATGDYIMFIDSDDYILPGCIKTFTDEIYNNSTIDLVTGSTICKNNTDIKKRELLNSKESIIHGFLTMKFFITSWNKLIRRECIVENKLLFIEGIYLQDQPWLYTLAFHINSMLLLPKATYVYEEAPESASRGVLIHEKAQRYVKSWSTVFEYYLSHRPNSKDYEHNLEVDFLLYLNRTHLRAIKLFPYEKEDYIQILRYRDRIMSLALKDGRFIIACFLLFEYRPFIDLFRFKYFRTHYYYMVKIVSRIAHLFDFIHRKN
jgi:glycosyltransferase involved in cell wall biosynthesis